jgi:hypothetical protein
MSVSCSSSTACTAVGYWEKGKAATLEPIVESWDGSKWADQAVAVPKGGIDVSLDSPPNWSIEPTASTKGAADSFLNAVSCSSASSCQAVGYAIDPKTTPTLAEGWNGRTWQDETIGNPTKDADNYLYGVSCVSATSCGSTGNSTVTLTSPSLTLAEAWNGKAGKPTRHPTSENYLLQRAPTGRTFCASGPLRPTTTSNSTDWPSSRLL